MSQDIVLVFQVDPDAPATKPEHVFLDDHDDVVALERAYTLFPAFRILPDSTGADVLLTLVSIQITQRNNKGWWKAAGQYSYEDGNTGSGGLPDNSTDPTAPEKNVLEQIKINFNIGGGTRHITKGLSVVSSTGRNDAGPPPNAPDLQGAIGVTANGITGADVPDDVLVIQITAYYRPSFIDTTFITALKKLAGKRNDAEFLGQAAGEVLFSGATGGGAIFDVIPFTFTFEVSENIVDQPDPGFPNLTAEGHDLIDYLYVPKVAAEGGFEIQEPEYRYVHRTSNKVSFAPFGFGSPPAP